ncbi:MAG: hypothetical protein ABI609_09775 [Acidobacteriota bacterium]
MNSDDQTAGTRALCKKCGSEVRTETRGAHEFAVCTNPNCGAVRKLAQAAAVSPTG